MEIGFMKDVELNKGNESSHSCNQDDDKGNWWRNPKISGKPGILIEKILGESGKVRDSGLNSSK